MAQNLRSTYEGVKFQAAQRGRRAAMTLTNKIKRRLLWVIQYSTEKIFAKIAVGYIDTSFIFTYRVHPNPLKNRLKIAKTAIPANTFFNVSSGDITIGDYVFFGNSCSVITGTHDINKFGFERQIAHPKTGRDITIKEGYSLAQT